MPSAASPGGGWPSSRSSRRCSPPGSRRADRVAIGHPRDAAAQPRPRRAPGRRRGRLRPDLATGRSGDGRAARAADGRPARDHRGGASRRRDPGDHLFAPQPWGSWFEFATPRPARRGRLTDRALPGVGLGRLRQRRSAARATGRASSRAGTWRSSSSRRTTTSFEEPAGRRRLASGLRRRRRLGPLAPLAARRRPGRKDRRDHRSRCRRAPGW